MASEPAPACWIRPCNTAQAQVCRAGPHRWYWGCIASLGPYTSSEATCMGLACQMQAKKPMCGPGLCAPRPDMRLWSHCNILESPRAIHVSMLTLEQPDWAQSGTEATWWVQDPALALGPHARTGSRSAHWFWSHTVRPSMWLQNQLRALDSSYGPTADVQDWGPEPLHHRRSGPRGGLQSPCMPPSPRHPRP